MTNREGPRMYLCVCQAIREACLAEIGKGGIRPRRARELFGALGKRPQCGICLRHIQGKLDALARKENGLTPVADVAERSTAGLHSVGGAQREQAA